MNRNEWIRRNNQDSSVPSSRKKKKAKDFNPDKVFLDQAKADFIKRGGKIKLQEVI